MLEIDLRERPSGGGLLPAPRASAAVAFGHRRLVLLLHGFNLTADGARKAYDALARRLGEISPAARVLLGDLVGVLWPGDAAWGPLSFASFPLEIRPARDSGLRLGAWLQGVRGPGGGPVEIFLVSHSLGNRVAMELLAERAAQARSLAFMRGSCLMAAAVPVPMMAQRFAAAAAVARTSTLYSAADAVLHWAFPLGETVAREGWLPQAVGLLGRPPGAWTESHAMVHANGRGYGHGDYWDGAEVAGHVARLLGMALDHELPQRAVLRRALPDESRLARRALAGRQLPTTPAM